MNKVWILLALCALAFGGVFANPQNDESLSDETLDEYWYSDEAEKLGIVDPDETKHNIDVQYDDILVPSDGKDDAAVQEEIEQFRKELDEWKEESEEPTDPLSIDYQYEDNRAEEKDAEIVPDVYEKVDEDVVEDLPDSNEESLEAKDEETNKEEEKIDDASVPILEETQAILNEDSNEDNFPDVQMEEVPNLEEIIDETKQILEAEDSAFEESESIQNVNEEVESQEEANNYNNEADETKNEESSVEKQSDETYDDANPLADEIQNENGDGTQEIKDGIPDLENTDTDADEDTVNKVYADLNEDLEKLFDTWDKLSKDTEEKVDDKTAEVDSDDVLAYEEKYNKPFREDIILKQREELEESIPVNDINDETSLDKEQDDALDSAVVDDTVSYRDSSDEDSDNQDYEYQDDPENDDDYQNNADQDSKGDNVKESDISAKDKYNLDDTDILVREDDVNNPETKEDGNVEIITQPPQPETTSVKTISVDDLSPTQYDDLVKQFVATNKQALDPQSEDFARNVAPIHMTLSVDEALVVTSPNYPNAYPTNNVVDWIFEGEGIGIEFNLTDFAVNGNIGDYLLVKPGGFDESGSEGLVFTYTLKEPRRYRFLDVDRLFVRFVANPGLGFTKGFQFSVKMVAPPIAPSPDSDLGSEDSELLIPPPPATIAVNLGIAPPANFSIIREQFRQLIADMATIYINSNDIEHGLNTTSEAAQITSTSACKRDWPNSEECVLVEFGIPLVYEDEETSRLTEDELLEMWNTYVNLDPFALRLRRMGVTEFAVPDDGQILLVWLVIAAGAVISMAMLAFALWRYSCFEDYTRMPSFSDTDSIHNEKRNLDLYPTPHQTLPPLYGDADYKWVDGKYEDSTRADMGGFTNRSFAPDELLDMESDDEVIMAPRDRYTTDV